MYVSKFPTAQTFWTSNYFPVLTCQLTTSNLITAISAVSSPITTVSRLDTLSIAALKCSTLTGSCTNNIITIIFALCKIDFSGTISNLFKCTKSSIAITTRWQKWCYKVKGTAFINAQVDHEPNCNVVLSTYSILFHHCHHYIHQSLHCTEQRKKHTDHCHSETG